MPYELKSTTYFDRGYKTLEKNQLSRVNAAIDEVMMDPAVGENKGGDLAGCQAHKFKAFDQFFVLGYEVIGDTIYLQRIAPHGNFGT